MRPTTLRTSLTHLRLITRGLNFSALLAGCTFALGQPALALEASLSERADSNDDFITPADGVVEFTKPERMQAGGTYIEVQAPGYAAPCWTDVDGDGYADLVVGQFAGGKMKVYRGDGKGALAAGAWLDVDGKAAEVPGVW